MEGAKKRKIFISAHPNDRWENLDKVVDAINGTEDMVAVYDLAPSDGRRGIPDDVEAIVVFATLKYFAWANSGYASEFVPAATKGVRIIPILLEQSKPVIDLINMRIGKIQYIDGTHGIEKVTDKLCRLLGATDGDGDEDDGRPLVFVSYRSKDGQLMKKLVEIIRSSSRYENIRLWYDDTIDEGNDFSKLIMKKIKECKLFVLLITPNVLEDGNYVLTREFPYARSLHKRIFSVIGEPTDPVKMREKYGALGKTADIRHPGGVQAVIDEIAGIYSKK